jgi:hypothetical protein
MWAMYQYLTPRKRRGHNGFCVTGMALLLCLFLGYFIFAAVGNPFPLGNVSNFPKPAKREARLIGSNAGRFHRVSVRYFSAQPHPHSFGLHGVIRIMGNYFAIFPPGKFFGFHSLWKGSVVAVPNLVYNSFTGRDGRGASRFEDIYEKFGAHINIPCRTIPIILNKEAAFNEPSLSNFKRL